MIVLSGADVVFPDGIRSPVTVVLDGDRIVEVTPGSRPGGAGLQHFDLNGHLIVPGFIDVHVHGVDGTDTLDSRDAVVRIAAGLPKYGVTAFCPTTVACAAATLREVLSGIHDARARPAPRSARVLGAHLESNFINGEYRGAQPATFLRVPAAPDSAEILD
jgi:N-acetylglucosamine-6-phosphate deacetylase